MFHMGFVHAVLLDFATGRDGSSWDRERRLADALIEASTRFDGAFEPVADDPRPPASDAPPPPGGGGAIATVWAAMLGRALPAR